MDPDDPLAAILDQIDLYTESQIAIGLNPGAPQEYREPPPEGGPEDTEEEEESDTDSSDGSQSGGEAGAGSTGGPRRRRPPPTLQHVVLTEERQALLRLLIAGAFMPHMLAVRLVLDHTLNEEQEWENAMKGRGATDQWVKV